jgi:hypothetical protein
MLPVNASKEIEISMMIASKIYLPFMCHGDKKFEIQ